MKDQRIAVWRGLSSWYVELAERTPRMGCATGRTIEWIGPSHNTHAEAVTAARDWIKANPLVIDPKAAA